MKDEIKLRWAGNVRAQKQADEAYHRLWASSCRRKKKIAAKSASKAELKRRRQADWQAAERQRRSDMPYEQYLRSKHWKNKRRQALKHYGSVCCVCKSKYSLEVHHKNYFRLWREKMTDLEVRCHDCHANAHEESHGAVDSLTAEFIAMFRG